jgi:hypothetical protein
MSSCLKSYSRFLKAIIPSCRLSFQNRISVVYEFEAAAKELARLVRELDQEKGDLRVNDWGISQITLNDVFLQLCGNSGHDG